MPSEDARTSVPRGIAFRPTDDILAVEVKRHPSLIIGGASVAIAAATTAVVHQWTDLVAPVVVTANALYWFWPRIMRTHGRTTIEIRDSAARFVERGPFSAVTRVIPRVRLGLPALGQIVIPRMRMPNYRLTCLEFPQYLDGDGAGQNMPLQLLAGYPERKLEWLRRSILAWMTGHAGVAV